jgi:hypothetical protein
MEFKPIYTRENIKTETDENKLRVRLGELRNMLKATPRDVNDVDADRFNAMAKKLGKYDLDKSLDLQLKARQSSEKKQVSEQKKIDLENAITKMNEISAVWREDPDNKLKQDQLRDAWNRASTLGAKVQNPIDDYLREQYNATQTGLRQQGMTQQVEYQNKMIDAATQREANDQWYRSQQLALEREKMDRAERKALRLSGEEAQKLGQLENAEPIFDRLEAKVADDLMINTLADQITSPNKLFSLTANKMADSDTQAFANAKQMVRNMVGRDLSGAAIAAHEWGAFEANIPAYGDTPEILAQKKKNRADWINDKKNRGRGAQASTQQTPSIPKKVVTPIVGANGKVIK